MLQQMLKYCLPDRRNRRLLTLRGSSLELINFGTIMIFSFSKVLRFVFAML
jgi:hypothetical protein